MKKIFIVFILLCVSDYNFAQDNTSKSQGGISNKNSDNLLKLDNKDVVKEISLDSQDVDEEIKLKNTPSFDYVNFAGGKSKLEDFRGQYVYIDIWATWCGPCRAQIPYLRKIEEDFKGKKIVFVSISVDVDIEKWRGFVEEKKIGGIQLIADNNFNSDFIRAFDINSIPRFILIDPNGEVVHADATRPSDPDLESELEELLD